MLLSVLKNFGLRDSNKIKMILIKKQERIRYRIRQFINAITAKPDPQQWNSLIKGLAQEIQNELEKLKNSEKAHILRLHNSILSDNKLDKKHKSEMLELAILHDIGKASARTTLICKVINVLFSVANHSHSIAGAKFLKKHKQIDRTLIRRVLLHHTNEHNDPVLKKFQQYDDKN